jgi:pimeloyl-ACP methyl ester carboxylesterase
MIARIVSVLIGMAVALGAAACAQSTTTDQAAAPAKPAAQGQAATPGQPAPAAAAATQKPEPPPAKALVATSADGTKIAYEVTGSGPALLLVHGGGQTRRSWNQLGYVDRLSKRFTVITLDVRGTGESDKPAAPDSYALDKVVGDLLAVADAAKAPRFHVYAFGQGATVARYLAARSDRVISAVLVGTTMGPAVTGVFKDAITGMRAKWQPIIAAHAAGTLDVKTLPASDRAAWENGIASSVLALTSMMDYPPLEPAEIKAPTLWLVGAEDSAVENLKQYDGKLAGTRVTAKILSSVNYSDSFVKIDQVLAEVEPFLSKATGT